MSPALLGLFEQIRLANIYVHYDDIHIPVGRSFATWLQIKRAKGSQWLSAIIGHGQRRVGSLYFSGMFCKPMVAM